jgi:hypothetical protein
MDGNERVASFDFVSRRAYPRLRWCERRHENFDVRLVQSFPNLTHEGTKGELNHLIPIQSGVFPISFRLTAFVLLQLTLRIRFPF